MSTGVHILKIYIESQQAPQFTTEVLDARVQETETATFECYFAGNPKPGKSITENICTELYPKSLSNKYSIIKIIID